MRGLRMQMRMAGTAKKTAQATADAIMEIVSDFQEMDAPTREQVKQWCRMKANSNSWVVQPDCIEGVLRELGKK